MAIKIVGTTVIDDTRKVITPRLVGTFSDFHPDSINTITTVIDFEKPIQKLVMSGNVTFTTANRVAGHTVTLLLDTSTSGHTPTFPSEVKFGVTPTWSNNRHWQITLTCTGTTPDVRATAIGFDEPGAVTSSFSNWSMSPSAGWSSNGYGTSGQPWAAVWISFAHDAGNNRVIVVQGKGNSNDGSTQNTYYANYTGLTGITSVEAQYNVQSQSCGGGNCSVGYSYGPTPVSDGYNSGTYYTVPNSPSQLFLGWQAVSTSQNQSQSTQVTASMFSSNPDFRIKIVCTEGTFYSTAEASGQISLISNWGNLPAF